MRLLFLLILPLAAHDMWIEPASFRPQEGQIVNVKLKVGEQLIGDVIAYDPARIHRFEFNATPIHGRFRAESAGLHRIGYFSKPNDVELPLEKFKQYLGEEGLEFIRPAGKTTIKENFSRCAKSLVLTGPANASQRDTALGFPLELIAEKNPYLLTPGASLPVRLVYRDRPLTNALVVALNRAAPGEKVSARTDKLGRVRLPLKASGLWLIKAVHMIPSDPADYHSYWASLTFELP
ncbi:MAG: DUF4198 domain-containing protein [Acidobacteria bacterium]|nr:DUF4198 domain-containing protein [Acidobacteriota bacterium]